MLKSEVLGADPVTLTGLEGNLVPRKNPPVRSSNLRQNQDPRALGPARLVKFFRAHRVSRHAAWDPVAGPLSRR